MQRLTTTLPNQDRARPDINNDSQAETVTPSEQRNKVQRRRALSISDEILYHMSECDYNAYCKRVAEERYERSMRCRKRSKAATEYLVKMASPSDLPRKDNKLPELANRIQETTPKSLSDSAINKKRQEEPKIDHLPPIKSHFSESSGKESKDDNTAVDSNDYDKENEQDNDDLDKHDFSKGDTSENIGHGADVPKRNVTKSGDDGDFLGQSESKSHEPKQYRIYTLQEKRKYFHRMRLLKNQMPLRTTVLIRNAIRALQTVQMQAVVS